MQHDVWFELHPRKLAWNLSYRLWIKVKLEFGNSMKFPKQLTFGGW